MVTRTDDKLDSLLGEVVRITFTDGTEKIGVLEWDMALAPSMLPSRMYSVYVFGSGYCFVRKSHVKKIREWREKE